MLMVRRIGVFLLSAAGISLPTLPASRPAPRVIPDRGGAVAGQKLYQPNAKEFYLTEDEIGYIRPGFHITVNSITIPDDRRPVVDLSFKDDFDQPLDRLGKVTPGPLTINQVLAWWDAGTRYYTAYTTRHVKSPITNVETDQAAADQQGTWTDLELGHSTYRFKTVLPENYDRTKTHTLAIYATRNLRDILEKNYYDNVEYDFRPDGQPVTEFWDKTVKGNCNVCHNPLAAHGGSRQDIKLCVTCHNPQTIDPDTGRTVNFREMVHKIHRGENLPSVQAGTPYIIIGNQQSVHDYSHVVFPKDIRNCETCHKPPATQYANYFTYPSRAACGSCHDNVNWVTGEGHDAGPQADDSACASCHVPQGDHEWDVSILGAHTVPNESKQLKGIHAEILSVTNSAPGQKPTVTFKLNENDGTPIDPATLGSNVNVLMGGPTLDYAVFPVVRERADAASFNGETATYTFSKAIPTDATGSWAFSMDVRRTVTFDPAPREGANFTEGAFNKVFYAAVTDTEVVPRRQVVELEKCNLCHDRLVLHGGQRFNIEECVICHNPNGTDAARRPAEQGPPESIDFKRLIHRIHTGEELTRDFTVFGFGGSSHNYNEVLFPGDRRDCETCHVPGTQNVPDNTPAGRLPTTTLRDWYSPQQPVAAACLGCHDSQSAAAHAYVNTAPFGEACAACHGNEADFSVAKVHAQ